ncbi:MAG: hypothetical protein ACAI38_01920 [Myxococcota bacterium]
MVVLLAGDLAQAGSYAGNNGLMPNYGAGATDHSATRVDTEVFGWNVDFSAVAAVVTTARRGPGGRTRGQVLMVVWGTNSVRAIENIEINVITAADLPHDPVALDDAKSKLMDVDYNLARMYPQRPKKKKPDGWMSVETVFDPVAVGPTDCQAAVGFVLEARGQIRFQPHEVIPDVRGNCRDLRMSNVRTYWGRPDVAVAMAKFDMSPDEHEMSFRQPVSARWSRARELRILVRTNDPKGARTDRVTRALAKYGRIRIEGVGRGNKSGVTATQDLALLANRMGNEVELPREPGMVEGGADIVVTLGDDDPVRSAARGSYPRITYR